MSGKGTSGGKRLPDLSQIEETPQKNNKDIFSGKLNTANTTQIPYIHLHVFSMALSCNHFV